MSEVQNVIPLEYATPQARRAWWKIPADAILDVAVVALTVVVNLSFLDEMRPSAAPSSALVTLDALASIAWALMLLACAVVMLWSEAGGAGMHRLYAWGKLLLVPLALV